MWYSRGNNCLVAASTDEGMEANKVVGFRVQGTERKATLTIFGGGGGSLDCRDR